MENNVQEQIEIANNLKIIEDIAKSKMSKEAISRYGNIKVAHPELAIKAISLIAQATQAGQLDMISDFQFKELLKQLQEKKEMKFKK
jgi:DNA-binding TFAR19-related protein (PDSD5 family)